MDQANELKTTNYSGIFFSGYSDYSEKCIHATPEHVLLYVYLDEQVIQDRDKTKTDIIPFGKLEAFFKQHLR